MDNRRLKRKIKKRNHSTNEEIPCIIFLSSNEHESFDVAEVKENRQLKYINQYAYAHGLVPIRIVRRSCMGRKVCTDILVNCIRFMEKGRADAIIVANMETISYGEADAYHKVGMIREKGFRIFSVDEGELKMNLKYNKERK